MKSIRFIVFVALMAVACPAMAQFEDFEDEEKSTIRVDNNKKNSDREFMDKYAFGGSFGFSTYF